MKLVWNLLLLFAVMAASMAAWLWTQRRLEVRPQPRPRWWRHWLVGPQGRYWDGTMYGGFPMSVRIGRAMSICAPVLVVVWVGWLSERHNIGRSAATLVGMATYLAVELLLAGGLTMWERGDARLWRSESRRRR